jgi:hypothetical protein
MERLDRCEFIDVFAGTPGGEASSAGWRSYRPGGKGIFARQNGIRLVFCVVKPTTLSAAKFFAGDFWGAILRKMLSE